MLPERVNVPVPFLVSATLPTPFWITPPYVVELLSPPVANVDVVLAALLVIVPVEPEMEETDGEKPLRSSVPLTVTADAVPKALACPNLSVEPTSMVADPAKLVLAAVKVVVAAPLVLSAPVPLMVAGIETALVLVKLMVPLLVMVTADVGAKLAMALLYATVVPVGITTADTLPRVGAAPVVAPPVTVQLAPDDHKPPLAPVYVTDANGLMVQFTAFPVANA